MDFYLDDDARGGWDSMITGARAGGRCRACCRVAEVAAGRRAAESGGPQGSSGRLTQARPVAPARARAAETQLLESGGPPGGRGQVVRWLRTFPFAFISQREYVIARRFFRDPDGTLYACTKSVASGAAPPQPGMVRMEAFHSHWRSRTVPCPRGSGRPCTETVLLHFEDFRINERLARCVWTGRGRAGLRSRGHNARAAPGMAQRPTRAPPPLLPAPAGLRSSTAWPALSRA